MGGSTPKILKAPRHLYESAKGRVEKPLRELGSWGRSLIPEEPELPEEDVEAAEDAAEAIDEIAAQQETQQQTAADLERMRSALLNRGRQQTILTGAGGLEAPPRTRRRILLGD